MGWNRFPLYEGPSIEGIRLGGPSGDHQLLNIPLQHTATMDPFPIGTAVFFLEGGKTRTGQVQDTEAIEVSTRNRAQMGRRESETCQVACSERVESPLTLDLPADALTSACAPLLPSADALALVTHV
ncbi:hypothetical protein ONZ51_g10968 [Trametes cubensis]|uniref:Uncharacterized protein n=1 Tax=Trametes cubensis TaxID=1111947 RepID=A0AAD7TIF8_9APHY|nr:hypothetical protein ONZ51_g10968 [Trametes cubensis]